MNLNNRHNLDTTSNSVRFSRRRRWFAALVALLVCPSADWSATARAAPPVDLVVRVPERRPAWLQPYRVRYALEVPGNRAGSPAKSIIAQLPTGGWLRPDAADVAVQTADGQELPVCVLSHDPRGDTLIQFPRHGNDAWYWAYAIAATVPSHNTVPSSNTVQPKTAPPAPEGLTVEVRRWAAENIGSWAAVSEGLKASTNVIGNAVVAEVVENCDPVRPDNPHHFAASYRGYLKIAQPGVYRFFVNAEGSSFLFIDQFKVAEKTGVERRLTGHVPTHSIGVDIELTAGVHALEVHHVIGAVPRALGYCALMWLPPGEKRWAFVPPSAFVQADTAHVAELEAADKSGAAAFAYGIDDTLHAGDGSLIFLTRFEAVGSVADESSLVWDFGDGTTARGRSLWHVYFAGGDYDVQLRSGALPAFRHNVHIWAAPSHSTPLSLAHAVGGIAALDWQKIDVARLDQLYQFVQNSEQPQRWPLLEAMAARLLEQPNLDPKRRQELGRVRIEALARAGRGAEAVEFGGKLLREFEKIPSLKVDTELALADVYHRQLNEPAVAGKLYESIVTEDRRVESPAVRIAAIRWGDLYAESGDLTRAGDCYRQAEQLGGEAYKNSSLTGAITSGGLLRTAEQALRRGDIQHTLQLLQRIEMNYPAQEKLEGLYRLLRADADRQTGHSDDALRNYQILLKLQQWAGFHNRAMHGVADVYFRQGNFPQALEWLAKLKARYPDYYAAEKLADLQAQILAGTAGSQSVKKPAAFTFNFASLTPGGSFKNVALVPTLGISGPCAGLGTGARTEVEIVLPTPNLASAPRYAVEVWYREQRLSEQGGARLSLHLKESGTKHPGGKSGTIFHLGRTYDQWREIGVICDAPGSAQGPLVLNLDAPSGTIELAGLRVEAVTDEQTDSLTRYLKGANPE